MQRFQQVEMTDAQGLEYAKNQAPVLLVLRFPVVDWLQDRQHHNREPCPIDGDHTLQVCEARAYLLYNFSACSLLWGHESEPVTIGVTVLPEPQVEVPHWPVGCKDDQGPVGIAERHGCRLEIVEMKRQDDVIRVNELIKSLVILHLLHSIKGLDSRIPVF